MMRDVSILVVVDCSRQRHRRRHGVHELTRRFQSLLWWIAVVNAAARRVRGRCDIEVSILVVVDWQSSTRHRTGARPQTRGFQSLLSWIAVVNRDRIVHQADVDRFQSLLWWIAVVNTDRSVAGSAGQACFNPCCGGLQSSTDVATWPNLSAGTCFNPCCRGLAVVNTTQADRDAGIRGFNPCCRGLQSSTAGIATDRHRSCFNPCCRGLQRQRGIAATAR